MALYRACPADGVVVCFDEFGPMSLQPYPGHCYAQRKRPWRRRATYVRRGGVGYFFGAYDVHGDVLFCRPLHLRRARICDRRVGWSRSPSNAGKRLGRARP
jgi:hypothetical protein